MKSLNGLTPGFGEPVEISGLSSDLSLRVEDSLIVLTDSVRGVPQPIFGFLATSILSKRNGLKNYKKLRILSPSNGRHWRRNNISIYNFVQCFPMLQ